MRLAGIVLGLGLGGFVDGITLHQIMQWHNMGSAVLPPTTMDAMAQNMVWDGMFHAATLVLTLVGVLMLWSDGVAGLSPRRLSVLIGQMILGWGLFNLVEGVIDHHLLNIHHVRDMPLHVPLYDWIFLAVGGVGFSLIGLAPGAGESWTRVAAGMTGREGGCDGGARVPNLRRRQRRRRRVSARFGPRTVVAAEDVRVQAGRRGDLRARPPANRSRRTRIVNCWALDRLLAWLSSVDRDCDAIGSRLGLYAPPRPDWWQGAPLVIVGVRA